MSHIFISYSRKDLAFAQKIVTALADNNLDTWIDWKSIPKGEDWEQEIYHGIEEADAFIFLISPDSVTSEMCNQEIACAIKNAKRILPIFIADVDDREIYNVTEKFLHNEQKEEIVRLNFIKCRAGREDFNKAIEEIQTTIHTDTELHRKFILSSRKNEERRKGKNKSRNINVEGDVQQSVLISGDRNLVTIISSSPLTSRSKSKKVVLHNVPPLPDHYLPRSEDMAVVKGVILSKKNRAIGITGNSSKVGLHGMGGIGKSVLASAIAREKDICKVFPDGVIWLTIGQDPNITARQAQLAEALGDKDRSFEDEQRGKAALSELLVEKRCLIILDDVWDLSHVTAFNCLGQDCQLLITTRNSEIIRSINAHPYDLNVLSEEQALSLLAKWTKLSINELPVEARLVSRECGYLPLALAMVGAVIMENHENWGRILYRLQNADIDKINRQFPDYPYPNLLRAIQVSVEALPSEIRSRYLDLVVFPEDTPIPDEVLNKYWSIYGLHRYDIQDILETFVSRSLARVDENGKLMLHDLLHDYLRKVVVNSSTLHNQLLLSYQAASENGKWHTIENDGYFYEYLSYHLIGADREDDLYDLLQDFNWIERKVTTANSSSLIKDYILLIEEFRKEKELNLLRDKKLKTVESIQKVLSAQVHFLQRWDPVSQPSYLLQQFRNQSYRYGFSDLVENADRELGKRNLPHLSLYAYKNEIEAAAKNVPGHIGGIYKVIVSPDSKYIISASEDFTIKVWKRSDQIETWEILHTLRGHNGPVLGLALMQSGKYLISSGSDHTVRFWDLLDGNLIHTLWGHSSAVNCVQVSSNDLYVVSGDDNGIIIVWDMLDKRMIGLLKGHQSAVYSLDIDSLSRTVVSGSDDHTIKLWNINTLKLVHTFKGHTKGLTSTKFLPGNDIVVSSSEDGTIRFWDLNKKAQTNKLSSKGWILDFVISSDQRHLIVAKERTLEVWDLDQKTVVKEMSLHQDLIESMGLLRADVDYVVSASRDCTMALWDFMQGKCVHHFEGLNGMVNDIVVAHDSHVVVSYGNGEIKKFEMSSGEKIKDINIHSGCVNRLAISLDGYLVASASDDKTLKFWDCDTGKVFSSFEFNRRIYGNAFTPDGQGLVFSYDGGLQFIDVNNHTILRNMRNKKWGITEVAVTSNGKFALFAGEDGVLRVWNLQDWEEVFALDGHTSDISDIHTIQNKFAITASSDGTLKVWDLETGQILFTSSNFENVVNVCKTASLDNIVAISSTALGVFKGDTGNLILNADLNEEIWCCDSSSNGELIVLGDYTGGLHFYELRSFYPK